jgi:hypothetical protein
MSVSCECFVLSGRGLCVGLITHPEESYRGWNVWVWSWSLDNEEVLAQYGLSCHEKQNPRLKRVCIMSYKYVRNMWTVITKLPPLKQISFTESMFWLSNFIHGATASIGQGLLIIKASRSHSDTPHLVGLPWTSDQSDAEISTWRHTTLTRDRHLCLRRDSNS